ncbi:copper chaperone PCu(A)C [Henriciella aquimarina]|uniref:copper chaperone PCu(A)C n=1 Tax=Henriciella aquimarina TaxID=545261 RepID=UPI000A07B55F|nr:copper chaperone PCu(A)C [Henriciella aquimarina]
MKRLVLSCLLAPAFLAACQPGSTGSDTGEPVLSYEDAFIQAPLAGRDVTMGGIRITVEGGGVTLTGVTSDVAETVETHTMEMVDDRMTMRPVDGFEIKAGDTLVMDRGGNHLMLFGLQEDLAAGDTANITLTFESEGGETLTLEAEAEVRAVGE